MKENDKGQIARYTFFLTRLCRDIEKKIESLLSNSQLKVNVQKLNEDLRVLRFYRNVFRHIKKFLFLQAQFWSRT